MPLRRCTKDGKSGWRWGDQGKCYTGPGAKAKAARQGLAAVANGYQVTDEEKGELFRASKGSK